MRFLEIRALPGPNIYTHRSALVALLDLQEYTERESNSFPGLIDGLLGVLPGLAKHHCGLGYEGGFVDRLNEGTYLGHVIEHVALELQSLVGIDVRHGKTRKASSAPNLYRIVIEYKNEPVARRCLETALEIVLTLAIGQVLRHLPKWLDELKAIHSRTELGPSTQAIVDAAVARGIPVQRVDDDSLVQLGYGIHRRYIQATETSTTSSIGVDISCDKATTKRMLERAMIPVPRGVVVSRVEDAVRQLRELHQPLALKPIDGNQGRGVSLELTNEGDLRAAFARASMISTTIVVEEQFQGRDYRILVVGGRVVAACERLPASVVGDGTSTILQLIERENRTNPLRGEGHDKALTKIVVDDALVDHVKRRGRSLRDVPELGREITLRGTANLSTGGVAYDVTDEIHETVIKLCERAARCVGLDVCGIDLITPDISQPLPESGAGIIEVNAAPGIRMHHFPARGTPRDAGGAIVEMLFPGGSTGRIPIVSVTGTNGKTSVARMVATIFNHLGKVAGLTTTDGIHIGQTVVARGDLTGFHSARVILSDPTIEVAVLESARGGIVRRSLGYDWSDVGVLTNIQSDHLGQDGIETLEDLIHVKALIAERVREGGSVVLNADDPSLAALPEKYSLEKAGRKIVFFSLLADNLVVRRHIAAGGRAYWVGQGWLYEGHDHSVRRLFNVESCPCTLGGRATFQVANLLAATAAALSLGVDAAQIAEALDRFDGEESNPGRLNLYKVGQAFVLIDYGHNPGAFEAIAGFFRALGGRPTSAILGVPGDRLDDQIRHSGAIAAQAFDRIVIREDQDTRGRELGVVPMLLAEGIRSGRHNAEWCVVQDEGDALTFALSRAREGEVIALFYEDRERVMRVLQEHGAEPIQSIPTLEKVDDRMVVGRKRG